MSLDELTVLVPPPTVPIDSGSPEQWATIEYQIGTRLPADYKRLINTYGVGWFADWICVYSPFSQNLPLVQPDLWQFIGDDRGFPQYHHPFPTFPAPGGLLPWGSDDNRSSFCWLTEGTPDGWTMVNLDAHYSQAYRHVEASLTGLLTGWFAGRITGDWYPEDISPTAQRVFRQGKPQNTEIC